MRFSSPANWDFPLHALVVDFVGGTGRDRRRICTTMVCGGPAGRTLAAAEGLREASRSDGNDHHEDDEQHRRRDQRVTLGGVSLWRRCESSHGLPPFFKTRGELARFPTSQRGRQEAGASRFSRSQKRTGRPARRLSGSDSGRNRLGRLRR